MVWLVRCSIAFSATAIVLFAAIVCSPEGRRPWPALAPLRAAAAASSTVAGLVGLAALVVLDLRGRTLAGLAVGALAGVAGLPAFAILVHLLFPAD